MAIRNVQIHSAHSFVVEIAGEKVAAFTECSLPDLEVEIEEYKEGGQNEYVHMLPGPRKAGRVTLSRGLDKEAKLMKWYLKVLSGQITPATSSLSIILFDSQRQQLARWDFERAIPVKWTGPTLKSDQGAVSIEKLELAVHGLTVS
jgi:phage tail-like protein